MKADDMSDNRLEAQGLRIDEERRSGEPGDFLRTWHRRIRHRRPDGTWSRPYHCDSVVRSLGLDAVAMVLAFPDRTAGGALRVGLRTCRRPALQLDRPADPAAPPRALIWEVPAGVLERGDVGEAGRARRCQLEALEEMGARVPAEAFRLLGPPIWTSPGVIGERVWLYTARVTDTTFVVPEGDGSPMEQDAEVQWVPLPEALRRCTDGQSDAKTEIALRRFAAAPSEVP